MKNHKFNFDNPDDLLKELDAQRFKISLQPQIVQNSEVIVTKRAKIENLQQLKKPVDDEIAQLMDMRERGFLDRFAYREMLEIHQPKQLEIKRMISSLTQECNLLEAQINSYTDYVKPAEEFFAAINNIVFTYSIVEISLRGLLERYLLVPDTIRRSFYAIEQNHQRLDIEMLAIDSGLGETLIGQSIGKVQSSDPRFRDLSIEKTEIASDEILRFLSGIYSTTQKSPTYTLQSKATGGGAVQRWSDGARSDSYVTCNRCETLYFMGSRCEC